MLHTHKPESSLQFERFLWPVGNPYASRRPSGFLCRGSFQNQAEANEFVVRDGRIPLQWYFHNHPTPSPDHRGILCIHEDLLPVVPSAWRDFVYSYRMVGLRPPIQGHEEILLLAHLSSECFSLSDVAARLHQVRTRVGESWGKLRKTAFLTPPFMEQRADSSWSYFTNSCMEIGRELGEKVEVLDWNEFRHRPSFKGVMVLDLSQAWILADNYLLHFILSRGGDIFDMPYESDKESVEALSPYHGWRINKKPEFKEEPRKEPSLSTEYARKLQTDSFFPWPTWFSKWCRQSDMSHA